MSANGQTIVLASTSLYRRDLLLRLGVEFDCQAPDIDESPQDGEHAAELALRLAGEKAKSVAETLDSGLVIGSDQVADLQGELLGKPGSLAAARLQLLSCSTKQVKFHTAVVVINANSGATQTFADVTTVTFKDLDESVIDRYLQAEPALDCAGGFKSEGLGITLFQSIETSDPTALIGLPLIGLSELLRRESVKLP